MARIKLALESTLAVDKVHEQQQLENSDGEFDELYHQLDQPEPPVEETDETIDDSTVSDEPIDEADDNSESEKTSDSDQTDQSNKDSESATDETDTKDDDKSTDKLTDKDENSDKNDTESDPDEAVDGNEADQKEIETALESCLYAHSLAMEALLESRYRFATESIMDSGKSALQLGFKYAPIAIKHVSKTIWKALTKTDDALQKGMWLLVNYIKKRLNSYKHYSKKIESAKKTLELIKEKNLSIEPDVYPNERNVAKLKIADQLVLENSLTVAKTFAEDYFNNLDRNAVYLANSIRGILNLVISDKVAKPSQLVLNIGELNNFIITKIPSYAPRIDSLDTLVYKNQLPGDLMLIAHVPGKNNLDEDNMLQTYRNMKMFFGVNEQTMVKTLKVNYLSVEEIETCLDLLEQICHYGMSQENSFKKLVATRKAINATFTKYMEKLFKVKDRVTVRESMIEIVTPSIEALDKVYIGTTVQVDDYLGRLINASLVYINDSLKRASKVDTIE